MIEYEQEFVDQASAFQGWIRMLAAAQREVESVLKAATLAESIGEHDDAMEIFRSSDRLWLPRREEQA